jgi:hypothetical protein
MAHLPPGCAGASRLHTRGATGQSHALPDSPRGPATSSHFQLERPLRLSHLKFRTSLAVSVTVRQVARISPCRRIAQTVAFSPTCLSFDLLPPGIHSSPLSAALCVAAPPLSLARRVTTPAMAPRWSPGRIAACGLMMLASWTSTASADMAAGDYYVHSLPGAPAGPLLKMHAG